MGLPGKNRRIIYLTYFNFSGMIRSILVLAVIFIIPAFVSGQVVSKKTPRPDLPGSFIFEFGFNQASGAPTNFSQRFIGSNTINLYYQYPIRFGKSRFSFNPGIGFSFEKFKLKNTFTLTETTTTGLFQLQNVSSSYPGMKKSLIRNNYIDIPLEFRFDTKPEDIAHSFNIAIGGRAGYLIDASTKIKYKEDGEKRKAIDKQKHGMNPFRYGVYTRVGMGAFGIFTYYNISTLFEKDKGPDKTTMNTFTVGFSINGL